MDDYRHALRFALSRQANAYGFTLVVWGTGALAIWELGKPDPADVFAFIGGALVSISLIVGVVFGLRQPFRVEQPPRRPFSAMHLPSVPAAVATGWGLTVAVGGVAGFFVAAAAAVAVYQLLLSLEVAFALTPNRAARSEEGHARSR
jgi:hypothetical protein